MTSIATIMPNYLTAQRFEHPIVRLLWPIARFFPLITTTRRAYLRQAEIFEKLANGQKDLALAMAYYKASDVLRQMAE